MRTIAFAHREITGDDETETALVWDGYVGIRDPLRDNIAASVAACSYCQHPGPDGDRGQP